MGKPADADAVISADTSQRKCVNSSIGWIDMSNFASTGKHQVCELTNHCSANAVRPGYDLATLDMLGSHSRRSNSDMLGYCAIGRQG